MKEKMVKDKKDSKLIGENNTCTNTRKYICNEHMQGLCSQCFIILHARCNWEEIPGKISAHDLMDAVTKVINHIENCANGININHYIVDFEEEFSAFSDLFSQIKEKLAKIDGDEDLDRLIPIKKDLIQLHKSIIESKLYLELLKYKDLCGILFGDQIFPASEDTSPIQIDLEEYKKKVIKEMEEHKAKKIEKEAKEISDMIVEDGKKVVKHLEGKIEEEKKANAKLKEKNLALSKELKKQCEDFEREKKNAMDLATEEDKYQKESEVKETEKSIYSSALLDEIFERNIGSKISDIANFNLEIDMNEAKQKSLLLDLGSSKLRLPNIRKIKIDRISDGNKFINSFFQNGVPSKLELFGVNCPLITHTGIKMDFYIDSVGKAIRSVSKEIYLKCFEIKESELEQIFKSASNGERLVLYFSDIHCSRKLDFSVSGKYKTKLLSFAGCGTTGYQDRKSDWKTTPSSFRNIVEAISKSGLEDSLREVDIAWNETLKKDEVQAMFNELGMGHVSVVETNALAIK